MEEINILEFISLGSGSGSGLSCGGGSIGYGRGCGCGCDNNNGCGYGRGCGGGGFDDGDDGFGFGDTSGQGSSYDDGNGCGFGSGLKSINGKKVYMVDGLPTTISHIHGNIAKGTIVNSDLTQTLCYIVKEGIYFAHGETLAEANAALQDKLFEDMPVEKRTTEFWKCHKKGVKYLTKDFFEWHHKLTGSCLLGRHQFAKDHGVDRDGEMTVEEFIALTKNAFGGDIIKRLEENY